MLLCHLISICASSTLRWRCVIRFSRTFFTSVAERMANTKASVYEEAVYALNGLQSNSAYLEKARKQRSANAYLNLLLVEKHLKTLGIKPEHLDNLSPIHVAGTKGKGSTCAFSELILRKHGFKTGLYSSPHVISVNERIKIDGSPLSKEVFAKYFWEVYTCIQQSLKDDDPMPHYFLFLTVMAFYVFVKEQVEAAVIEVGIGGLYDCTNILRRPLAVGITTLGIDHVSILGNTLSEIAAQKAGIFKSAVPAYTVPQQEAAMRVLRKKALEIGCSLFMSPPLEAYEEVPRLGAQGIVQNINASLALQLTNTWLKSHSHTKLANINSENQNSWDTAEEAYIPLPMANVFNINSKTQEALENCVCPGRFQTVEKDKITFFLDGAHTQESIRHCARWFQDEIQRYKKGNETLKVLLFNCTGDRKAENLLDPLTDIAFDVVLFCPNRINVMKDASSDLSNFMVDPQKELQQCRTNRDIWCHMMNSLNEDELSLSNNSIAISSSSRVEHTLFFPSISSALSWLSTSQSANGTEDCKYEKLSELVKSSSHVQVLVTGSLHLVGGVLSLIQS